MNTKFCGKAKEWFSPYFDGILDRDDCSKLEEHFHVCSYCKIDYDKFKSLFEQVRSLPEVPASEMFEARLRARIRREGAPTRRSWWQDFSRIPLPVPLGAAAVLLVAVFAYTRSGNEGGPARALPEPARTAEVSDTIRTRTNTLPSFLEGTGPNGGVGRVASAGGGLAPVRHHLVDMNGVPLEGPYFETESPPVPRGGGSSVDTSRGR
ncbi:MAG: zf-HC2 domain-containing protein [Candidatus Eisenbacteria bacterium]